MEYHECVLVFFQRRHRCGRCRQFYCQRRRLLHRYGRYRNAGRSDDDRRARFFGAWRPCAHGQHSDVSRNPFHYGQQRLISRH